MVDDAALMGEALAEAQLALDEGEVPVGCVLVQESNGRVVGRGRNATHCTGDATTHAELVALRALNADHAARSLLLYVTCEPCIMCASALRQCGLFKRVVYGCSNARFGGCGSVRPVLGSGGDDDIPLESGVRSGEALALLVNFYGRVNPYAPKPKPRRASRVDTVS